MGGLSRLRAKQLSAAEVKRGLRRNVTGGGQNIIPTMSFYAPKVFLDVTTHPDIFATHTAISCRKNLS